MATVYALKPAFQSLLRPLVGRLAARSVTANQVTLAAAGLSLAYGGAIAIFGAMPILLLGFPVVLLVRMGLNAIDGMLAREHGQESRLGFFLNEIADVVSDAALYLPLAVALAPGFGLLSSAMVIVFALSEYAGVLGRAAGGSRRYDGPFGKSDRAVYFSILAVAAAVVDIAPPLAAAPSRRRSPARRADHHQPRPRSAGGEGAMIAHLAATPVALAFGLAGVWSLLAAATAIVAIFAARGAANGPELLARTRTWWIIVTLVTAALLLGATATAILFAVVSFLALREYFSIIPVRQVDRAAILIAYLAIPIQYWFVHDAWYGMFSIFIPVYMTAAISFRLVLAGETKGFIRSAGTLQWGLLLTVYNLSHLAYLTVLPVKALLPAGGAGLLLFVLVVVQFNDVAQYAWGKLLGRTPIAPHVSPKKTWEGFVGGLLTSMAAAALLSVWLTPFGVVEGAIVGGALAALGFGGDVTISAVKRDLGIKDFGAILPGHGGILDRLDSLVFSAPLFLHYVRYFYGA